jgi:phage tail-like protein
MTAVPSSYYPPVAFNFRVDILGIIGSNEGNFQEVSGLNVSLDMEEIKEGGENRFSHRFPTRRKYENLVLKRGMITQSLLIIWARMATELFIYSTKTVVLSLLDETGFPQAVWCFANAYPIAIKTSEFKAQENAIVVETLELSFDYFMRII